MSQLDPTTRSRHKLRNMAQAVVLLGGMAGMLGLVAWLLFGLAGLFWMLAAGAVAILFRPNVPAEWILSMYGAQRLPRDAAPELHRYVRILSKRAGLDRPPELYYVATPILNALAVGRRDDPALTVTDGLMRNLTARELVAVLAHEISHIRSNDLWIMSLSDTVGRLTHMLAYLGLFVLLFTLPVTMGGTFWPLLVALALTAAPTVVTLLQLALSRSREYDADLEAAATKIDSPPMPCNGLSTARPCSATNSRARTESWVTSVAGQHWGKSIAVSFSWASRRPRGLFSTSAPARSAASRM